ncbi:MAG: DUF3579 domain-containing protein [Gammaproteobacteria bacterium]|nr:DUF3579 domain-containing protein [Gammaproteobacteria bacterium]
MVFSDKQKSVTESCVVSDDKDYWLVGSEGTRLRPSNWPERIASTFIQMDEFATRRKLVSECVSIKNHNGRLCLKVRKKFQQGCGRGWEYIESFAKSNDLRIVDNDGEVYTPSSENNTACHFLDKAIQEEL